MSMRAVVSTIIAESDDNPPIELCILAPKDLTNEWLSGKNFMSDDNLVFKFKSAPENI